MHKVTNDVVWRRAVRFSTVFAAGWAAALAFHLLMGAVLHRPHPWNTFLFFPPVRFSDLVDSWAAARAPNPYLLPESPTWFPFSYVVLSLARGLTRKALVATYLATTAAALLAVWLAWAREERARWRGDRRWALVAGAGLAVCVGSYPLLFAVDRGNVDPLIAAALVGGLGWIRRGHDVAGGGLVALSAAFKGYSFAGVLLLVKRRRWLATALTAATLALLVLVPAHAFEGGIAASLGGLRGGMAAFREGFVVGSASAHYSADWINGIRLAVAWGGGGWPDMTPVVRAYELVALVWAGLLATHVVLFSQEAWRETLGIVLIMLVFPNVTNDYKLVLLVPAVLAWLSSAATGWRSAVFGASAALLLVPKHYHFPLYHLYPWCPQSPPCNVWDASVSCLVSPLLLVALSATLWPTRDEREAAWRRLAGARAVLGGRAAA